MKIIHLTLVAAILAGSVSAAAAAETEIPFDWLPVVDRSFISAIAVCFHALHGARSSDHASVGPWGTCGFERRAEVPGGPMTTTLTYSFVGKSNASVGKLAYDFALRVPKKGPREFGLRYRYSTPGITGKFADRGTGDFCGVVEQRDAQQRLIGAYRHGVSGCFERYEAESGVPMFISNCYSTMDVIRKAMNMSYDLMLEENKR